MTIIIIIILPPTIRVADLLKLPKSPIQATSDSSDPTLSPDSRFLESLHPGTYRHRCRAICHGPLPSSYQVNPLQLETPTAKTSIPELQTLLYHSPRPLHIRQKQTPKTTILQLDNILLIPSLSDDHLHLHLVMTERPVPGLDQVGDPGLLVKLPAGILLVRPWTFRPVDLSGVRPRMLIILNDQ
jgi:hypothetical protein